MNDNCYVYDPSNMQMQMPQVPQLTDLTTGFIRGNMFQRLYDPWRQGINYLSPPSNERAAALRKIQEIGFAMVDLNLYLDTNSNDQEMLQTYNALREQKDQLKLAYEQKFGPLTLMSPILQKYPWAWIPGPWPWEKEAN
ncbi:MAG: spore coat protein CotJB [Bacilli bacterium]